MVRRCCGVFRELRVVGRKTGFMAWSHVELVMGMEFIIAKLLLQDRRWLREW